uniref:acetyl-CoA carboxylase beta subunit n=1 Tax=Prosopanche bonacinae TaxID=2952648 RepID=UPI00211451FD|nr:acetyl-CoA carboxylase beta subunit [Prosopanche bonacinae]USN93684.1 acetyl-CoA carboxylase beta subunit [Prosopanche bonacinae]
MAKCRKECFKHYFVNEFNIKQYNDYIKYLVNYDFYKYFFRRRAFKSLLRYKPFKNSIYNFIESLDFIDIENIIDEKNTQKISKFTNFIILEDYVNNRTNKKYKRRYTLDGDPDFRFLWVVCENCNYFNYKDCFLSQLYICEVCGYHIKMNSSDRIKITIDENTWKPLNKNLFSIDPIEFDDTYDIDSLDLIYDDIDATIHDYLVSKSEVCTYSIDLRYLALEEELTPEKKEERQGELYVSFEDEVVNLIEKQKQLIKRELDIEEEGENDLFEERSAIYAKMDKRDELLRYLKEDEHDYEIEKCQTESETYDESFDELEKTESYLNRLNFYQTKTKLTEAVQTGIGKIKDINVALGVMDSEFIAGSMGSAVGEKLTRLIEYATQQNLPLIIFCASGGARIQEGSLSLIQMAKISAALLSYKLKKNSIYISILTSPTTGGVTASFGMLGDIIISEPDATIAFAGQRVIEQLLNEEVPEGSQEAENLFENGSFDLIVPRQLLTTIIAELLKIHGFYPCS